MIELQNFTLISLGEPFTFEHQYMYASSPYHSSYISYGTYIENLSINQELVCAVFSYSFPNSFMCIFLLDELFWTALHQLYQWKTATAFQSHNVHFGAGTVSNFLRVSLDVPSSAVFDFLQLLDKRCQNFYTIQDILNMSFMHLTCFEVVSLVATMNWVQESWFWTRYV